MAGLASERCQECLPGTPPLSPEAAAELATSLEADWVLGEKSLRRRFRLRDFVSAFTAATRIALLAEKEGHHPDLGLGWGYLEVEFSTHSAGGLTRNDFVMAAKVDRMALS